MPVLSINADGGSKTETLATLFKRFWSINPGQLSLLFPGLSRAQPLPSDSKAKAGCSVGVAHCPGCSRRGPWLHSSVLQTQSDPADKNSCVTSRQAVTVLILLCRKQ